MDAQEQQTLQRAQKMETKALVEIFDQYSSELYRYALRRTGFPQIAEDCVSETFTRFLKSLQRPGQHIKTSIRAYLYRTAHNWLIDQHRKEPVSPEELDEAFTADHKPSPEQQILHNDQAEHMRTALQQLPPTQQQVIALRYLEEWSLRECAEAMGKSVGAIKTLQNRAMKNLKKQLVHQEH